MTISQCSTFRQLVHDYPPLQIVGTINAYCALLAEQSGCKAIYLSGAGVANASYGVPDLGITSLADVLEDARRITDVCSLPLLVDVDTGWGNEFNIARTVKSLEKAQVAAIHLEDQVSNKRCGHRPNKSLVSMQEMGDRIKAAVDARINPDFIIMARTDACASEGLEAAVGRAQYYVEQGADMIFAEAITRLEDYQAFVQQVPVPILANITEFGKTPLFSREELAQVGIKLILYPLSAFRAMSHAARGVYQQIIKEGTQKALIQDMQTRDDLYKTLDYLQYEHKLDELMEEKHG